MLKYNDFVIQVYEYYHAIDHSPKIDKSVEFFRNSLKKSLGDLLVIKNLDSFVRENEPIQQRTTFSTKKLETFGVNFTTDGDIHSIDFFKPPVSDEKGVWSKGSEVTMYIKKATTDQLSKLIPVLLKDPKPINQSDLHAILNENLILEEEKIIDVSFTTPPKNEITVKNDDQYTYGDPDTIFKDLEKWVDMVIEGKQPSLVVTGSPGVGKTFRITKQLESRGLKKGEDWVHIKGRSTPAGLYIALFENMDKVLVIDDCDSIFKNDDAVNILKGALDSYEVREISWLVGKPLQSPSTGQKIPTNFTFTGKVIFISNLPQKKIDYAIKSRSFVLEVALTPEDMIKQMETELPNIMKDVPISTRKLAFNMIRRNYKEVDNLELSMRTLIKAIKIIDETDSLDEAERLIIQQCSYK